MAEMRRRLATGEELTGPQWQRALTRTGVVTIRSRWPAGIPVTATILDSAWLDSAEIEMVARDRRIASLHGGAREGEDCGNETEWRRRAQMAQYLGFLPIGRHHLEFETTIS